MAKKIIMDYIQSSYRQDAELENIKNSLNNMQINLVVTIRRLSMPQDADLGKGGQSTTLQPMNISHQQRFWQATTTRSKPI